MSFSLTWALKNRMSAIFGKFNFNQKPIVADELFQIEKALNHWDADDKGLWHNESIGLGHLMLYNTPESLNDKLPFYKSENQLTITADARIDNREELFTKLNLAKNDQILIADSTLILYAYEKYGEDCVKHLIGDFAFAIWDQNEQKLFCARDHMGIKPFFYYHNDYFFAFATEPRGLLAIDGLNNEIDEIYFYKLTAGWYPEKAETAYKYISRLNCATALTVKNKTLNFKLYWELDATREVVYKDRELYIEHFRELFNEAIKCRLRSNYLIGTELSGGLDSSGIAVIAAGMLHSVNKKIASFTSFSASKDDYENPLQREELFADEVIAFAAIDFVYKRAENEFEANFLNELDSRIETYGYPSFATNDWNSHFYKTAQKMNVRTMLSGHGGDQLVTDQNQSYTLQYINDRKFKTYFKEARKKWGFVRAFKNAIKANLRQPLPAYIRKLVEYYLFQKLKNAESNFLTPAYYYKIKPFIRLKSFPRTFKEAQKKNIIENIFVSDRVEFETLKGLKYKICPAFPMLDIRLMEYVLAVPTTEKMQPGKDRLLYRAALSGLMPDNVVNRKTKHIDPKVFHQQLNWINRQPQVKKWILDLEKNNKLEPFINYPKVFFGYDWQLGGKIDFNGLLTPKRKQIESIIRWFEKNPN